MSFVDLPVKRGFDSSPLSHFSRTHYSTIPLFHHSNCERSELTWEYDGPNYPHNVYDL